MGNNSVTVGHEPKFWRIVSVMSLLVAAVAIVLCASFAQDFKAQQARGDQATQQLAGLTSERDQAKAKVDEVAAQAAALTEERDGLKAKVEELTGKLAASGADALKGQLATVIKERDELRAKVEELTAAAKGTDKAEKKPAHHEAH